MNNTNLNSWIREFKKDKNFLGFSQFYEGEAVREIRRFANAAGTELYEVGFKYDGTPVWRIGKVAELGDAFLIDWQSWEKICE